MTLVQVLCNRGMDLLWMRLVDVFCSESWEVVQCYLRTPEVWCGDVSEISLGRKSRCLPAV